MRKLILIFILSVLYLVSTAQRKITRYEYWFDGNFTGRTIVPVTPVPTLNLNQNISTSSLQRGLHTFHIMFRDSAMLISSVLSQQFYRIVLPSSSNKMVAYEYWFDKNYAGKVTQAVTPSATLNLVTGINTSSLTKGLHNFYIRFKSEWGEWTDVSSEYFYKVPLFPGSSKKIVGYEYWFDQNYAGKISQSVSPQTILDLVTNVNINAVSKGLHTFHIRFKDEMGGWTAVNSQQVLLGANKSGLPNAINGYRYWIDTAISKMKTINLAIISNPRDVVDQLNLAYLDTGKHFIYLQFRDLQNSWSSPLIDSFFQLGKSRIDTITPAKGGNTGDVTLNITGTGFFSGTSVKLTRTGFSDIVVPDSMLSILYGQRISATLNLRNKALGLWNVVVTVPGDTVMTKTNAFEIIQGDAAAPWARLEGFTTIRVNRWQTFTITYGNTGNIDARAVPIWLALPQNMAVEFDFAVLQPSGTNLRYDTMANFFLADTLYNNPFPSKVYMFLVPVIAPGQIGTLNFRLKPAVAQPFKMAAWATPPMYGPPLKYIIGDCIDTVISTVIHRTVVKYCAHDTLERGFKPYFDYYRNPDVSDWNYAGGLMWSFNQSFYNCYNDITLGPRIMKYLSRGLTITDSSFYSCVPALTPGDMDIKLITVLGAIDPNAKIGPSGAGPNQFVSNDNSIPYIIHFENKDSATASAQTVVIIDSLNISLLDLSTFQFGYISLADSFLFPLGYQAFTMLVDLRPANDLILKIVGSISDTTGIAKWTFTSIDPVTLLPTTNPTAGFLPPNVTSPQGEGSVFFSIKAKNSVANNTIVSNKAYIFFDGNAPIKTNTYSNKIDNIKPHSNVVSLPKYTLTKNFTVRWNGNDTSSGVYRYSIYYAVNNGPYNPWILYTRDTMATFSGSWDSTYSFYSVVMDSAMNLELPPAVFDARTTLHQCNATSSITASGPVNFCVRDSVTLTANLAKSYLWSGGDTTRSIVVKSSSVLTVMVTDTFGCSATSTPLTVTVYPLPKLGYTINNSTQCLNANSFSFNDTSGTLIVGYTRLWNFGDGGTSTLQNPLKTYTGAGTYNVKLKITTSNGCVDSVTKSVTVYPVPATGFTTNNNAQCFNTHNFSFNDTTSTAVVTHTRVWDFGDGTTTTSPTPSKTYTLSGGYVVKLVITTSNGCKDSVQKAITVFPLPKMGYTVNNSNQCLIGNSFSFNDTASTLVVGYTRLWSFGDGSTSTLQNPLKTYPTGGTYNVKLKITTANGCIDSVTKTITVYPQPQMGFTISATNQCLNGNSIIFTDTTNTSLVGYTRTWYFGDGSTSQSVTFNKTFAVAGIYNVKLVIITTNGCKDSVQKTVTIYPQTPVGFTTNISNQCINTNSFNFTDTTNTNITGYTRLWTFGDGTTSTLQNAIKKYTAAGTYNVKLNISTTNGCLDSVTKTVTVYPSPLAGFTINNSNQCFNTNNFTFNDTTSSAQVSHIRLWDFGDGTTSILAIPNKVYNTAGTYIVKLKITTSNGCTDSMIKPVTVYPLPLVGFTINNPNQCYGGNSFSFLDTTGTTLIGFTRIWDFGDGVTSTQQSFIKSYANPGSYIVKLKITSANGCKDSVQKAVTIFPKITIGYTYTKVGCDYAFSFNDTSKNVIQRLWNFGDGTTDIAKTVTKNYTSPGVYVVSLKITDNNGCMDSIMKTVVVVAKPQPGFTINNPNQCLRGNLFFVTDTSSGTYTSREWAWSDGKNATSVADTHVISTPGNYTIKLKLFYGLNCVDSLVKNIIVYVQPKAVISSIKNSACVGDSILLSANSSPGYLWNTGAATQNIYVKTSGTYSLKITNASQCFDTISKTVIFHPLPPVPVITHWGYSRLHSSAKKNNQWYLNTVPITGANDTLYIATANGDYTVAVTDSNGCVSFSLPRTHNINGINDVNGILTYSVYPNPNGGSFTILGLDNKTTLKVFDASGKQIEFTRNKDQIVLTNASKGMYYLQLFNDDKYIGSSKIAVK